MKKNIRYLVGILSCIIIILAGLSPVIGYKNVVSSVKDSPLFHLRTQRAIDKEQNIQRCTYLGKGKEVIFPVFRQHNKVLLHKEMMEALFNMNDKELYDFAKLVINNMNHNMKQRNIDINDVLLAFSYLKENPKIFKNYDTDENNIFTYDCSIHNGEMSPGCLIILIISLIIVGILTIIDWFLGTAGKPTCAISCNGCTQWPYKSMLPRYMYKNV
jgi:hypothetical protein